MTNEAKVGEGDVKITLNGTTHYLRPTWEAAFELSRQSGGLLHLQAQCQKGDMEAIVIVVAAGLGRLVDDEFRQEIYANGIWGLTFECMNFVSILSNGGKPIKLPSEDKKPDPQPIA